MLEERRHAGPRERRDQVEVRDERIQQLQHRHVREAMERQREHKPHGRQKNEDDRQESDLPGLPLEASCVYSRIYEYMYIQYVQYGIAFNL